MQVLQRWYVESLNVDLFERVVPQVEASQCMQIRKRVCRQRAQLGTGHVDFLPIQTSPSKPACNSQKGRGVREE